MEQEHPVTERPGREQGEFHTSDHETAGQRLTISFAEQAKRLPFGLRGFFEYRDLGVKAATKGRFNAHVVSAKKGSVQSTGRHRHDLDFQFIYILKGTATVRIEGEGVFELKAGDTLLQPPGVAHEVVSFSEDHEFLEITAPADYPTIDV